MLQIRRVFICIITLIVVALCFTFVSSDKTSAELSDTAKEILDNWKNESTQAPAPVPSRKKPSNSKKTPKPTPVPSPTPQPVKSTLQWNPEAKCQITKWDFTPGIGSRAVKLTITFRSGKTQTVSAVKEEKNGDEYFLVKNLPAGLQVVLPGNDEEVWVINCDSRPGYVKKIINPQNISTSQLSNGDEHKDDYGGKTFQTGDAIILVKQSGLTIRPYMY